MMYYNHAMKEEGAIQFKQVIIKETKNCCNSNNWTIVKQSSVLLYCEILLSVWSMKQKRDLITQQPIKYKARLNIYGDKQEYGVNYHDIFSTEITWTSLLLLLLLE